MQLADERPAARLARAPGVSLAVRQDDDQPVGVLAALEDTERLDEGYGQVAGAQATRGRDRGQGVVDAAGVEAGRVDHAPDAMTGEKDGDRIAGARPRDESAGPRDRPGEGRRPAEPALHAALTVDHEHDVQPRGVGAVGAPPVAGISRAEVRDT